LPPQITVPPSPGVKQQRTAKDAQEFARGANSAKSKPPSGFEKAKAFGFRPRKG
jgi:hypothetical protein